MPLYTKLARASFDVTVYMDPPEEIRIGWKLGRDTKKRGYTEEQVREELGRREPESAEFIRPHAPTPTSSSVSPTSRSAARPATIR